MQTNLVTTATADPTAAAVVTVTAVIGLVVVVVTGEVSQHLNQHHLHNCHPLHNQHLHLHNVPHQLVQSCLLMVTHHPISVLMVMVYMIMI